ncbi:hypothetical protein JHK82_040309 [Glycine max]|nr:hypothetical protein JHK82_040309 [Glycine max]
MEATLPSNWKNLTIEKYDGTNDPDEHLDVYISQANLYTTDDVVLCRVFPTSLKVRNQLASSPDVAGFGQYTPEEERIALDTHGLFWKDNFGYLKPRLNSCHARLDNNT